MKQSLQLHIGQQLTMTPQLQQAIKLLQLSSFDLQQEIQQALDSNVMLELDDDSDTSISETSISDKLGDSSEASGTDKHSAEAFDQSATNSSDSREASEQLQAESIDFEHTQNNIPDELPLDSKWEDIYDSVSPLSVNMSSNAYNNVDDSNLFENNGKTEESLRENLLWQLELTPFSDSDKRIAETIIDAINEDGYLSLSLEQMLEGFNPQDEIELDEVEAVLHRIQNFDPVGVAARDLQETLLLQLKAMSADTSWLSEAKILVTRHLKLLGNKDFSALKRRMKLDENSLSKIISLIRSLRPRPGGHISDNRPQYITPDVYVRKINGEWIAELNPDSTPQLRVNMEYLGLIKGVRKNSDMTSIKDHLQEARWFIKSLQSRNETLLKVARCILDFQRDYFEYGEEHMRALVLADVAEVVEMHESTISRVTTQKYMHTPRGIFELKYFFSSHVNTASGGEASATAIRAIIKKIIAQEDQLKPLSDNKISNLLAEQNYKVARRTVAKYRESMSIPPSNERKNIA
jgi:RNA polymerase sigma-54 factor